MVMTDNHTRLDALGCACLPTHRGEFSVLGFRQCGSSVEHAALFLGEIQDDQPTLTRIHSQCLTGDVFGSLRCDCGEQLTHAMDAIIRNGRGLVIYLNQEGRGIGLVNKIRAYALQDDGADTVEANERLGFPVDSRDYAAAVEILRYFSISAVRLMTNNPGKVLELENAGISVERIPIRASVNRHNRRYLATKHQKLGHLQ